MAWPAGFPAVDKTTNVQWHAFHIVSAMRERQTVTGRSLTALPVDKVTNIQNPAYWAGLQTEVDTLSLLFLDSAGNPSGFDGYAYASPWTLPNYTQATFRSGAGLHANGWLRRYMSGGSVVSAYGTMQADDIIGTHVFNELYQALQILVWQKVACGYSNTTPSDLYDGASLEDTWGQATTALAAAWADTGNPVVGEDVYYGGTIADQYGARAQRVYGKLENTENVSTAFKRDADYYSIAEAITPGAGDYAVYTDATFDAYGDGVSDGVFKKVMTDSPAAATTTFESGSAYGDVTLPAPAPTEPTPGHNYIRGYVHNGFLIVVRWDVTDGFSYQ